MENYFYFSSYFFEIFFTGLYILKHAGVNKKIRYIIPFSYCIILSLNIGQLYYHEWLEKIGSAPFK